MIPARSGLSHEQNMAKMRLLTFMGMAVEFKEISFDTMQQELQIGAEDVEAFVIDGTNTFTLFTHKVLHLVINICHFKFSLFYNCIRIIGHIIKKNQIQNKYFCYILFCKVNSFNTGALALYTKDSNQRLTMQEFRIFGFLVS